MKKYILALCVCECELFRKLLSLYEFNTFYICLPAFCKGPSCQCRRLRMRHY